MNDNKRTNGKYKEWLTYEKLTLITGWARDGLSDRQIALDKMHIAYSTFREWKKKYPDFAFALSTGKEVADYDVENELYKSAHTQIIKVKRAVKVKKVMKDKGKVLEEEKIEYVEEDHVIPANTVAQIFWLKNRRPDKWRDKPEFVTNEVYESDGLMEALDAAIDEEMTDDSWMIEEEEV